MMKYKSFGKTGINVSELILGTWYLPNTLLNGKRAVNKANSIKLIRKAYDLGINFFDTADVYRGVYDRDSKNYSTIGLAEKIVGEALKGYDRESFVVSTKVMGRTGSLVNDSGANRKHVRNAIRRSLERLQMEYVDFYMIHGPDENVGIEEAAKTMNMLQEDGLILHYGISNHSALDLVKFLNLRYFTPLEPPNFIQDKYNLLEREIEKTNLRVAEDNLLALMIYSPLSQGILAGRYLAKERRNSRLEYEKWFARSNLGGSEYKGYHLHERYERNLEKFREIAVSRGATMSQLALSWLIHKGKYLFPIIGATKIDQLEENVKCTEITLSHEEVVELAKIFESPNQ